MTRAVRLIALAVLLGGAAAVPASAEQKRSSGKTQDPNEMLCETQKEIGSRLAKKRVCMTRAQWAERRREDRDVIQKSQTQLCVVNPATLRC
jgi:hypothetical protein